MSFSSAEAAATGESLSALEALHSTPSRRYLAPDPIPEEVLWAILDAAIRGPSGGNSQAWGWVVVADEEVKRRVAGWYRQNWENAYGQHRDRILAGDAGSSGLTPRGFLGAEYLANHLEEAPVWVFPVLRNAAHVTSPRIGSSIYGAVQQLCLAARAYGIGTSLTTLYGGHDDELRELLGLPEDALTMALIPMGYPARGRWAEPKRRPVEEVVHWNRWGATRTKPLFCAEQRVGDLAEEDLGGLGPNALELLQPRGDLRAGPGGAHQARDGAPVVSRQSAHHVTQFLAHDRAQPVVVPLP
jgi:nitroreductase